ncbi:MAG: hypothetical protein ACRYHQ_03125 [Janthinobacterium lividum]
MTGNERDEAKPNGKARWKQRQAALAWEKPAKAAMTLAVLSSLGTLFAWTLMLVDGPDPRASPAFWAMVVLVGLWGAPVRVYVRWTMLTLWLALLVWPALVGMALLALWTSPPGTFAGHASLRWLTSALAATTVLSAAGLVCLRRSSLPGGTGTATFMGAREQPKGALPPVDGALVTAQLFLLMPFIPVALLMSGASAVIAINTPAPLLEGTVDVGMAIGAAFIALVVGVFAWGQRQARRWPARTPTGLLTAAVLLGLGGIGLSVATLAEGYAHASDGAMQAAAVMGVVALGVAALEAAAWRRLMARARSYGAGATGGRRATW